MFPGLRSSAVARRLLGAFSQESMIFLCRGDFSQCELVQGMALRNVGIPRFPGVS
jgi:hypothetical protein